MEETTNLLEVKLRDFDPEVDELIRDEMERNEETINLIASENYASRAVMEAQANVMTNKYAEGYPGARYYGGCDFVDEVERLAVDRARRLFKCEHANVQAHSGSQANMAVYLSFLKPGDVILGMGLAHGGHLTHGSKVSFSGKLYQSFSYGVDAKTQRIDYDQLRDLARQHRPKMIIAGASAYPRTIDFAAFKAIAREVDAFLLADIAHIAGLVAVGLHPTPIGEADVTSTTTHKTLRGPRGGLILTSAEYGPKIDKTMFPGIQGGPLMHVIAAKAVALGEALAPSFADYQAQVVANARRLAAELLAQGLELVSGGTDNHLLLIDLTAHELTGQDAEVALGRAGMVVNKNTIPFDKRGPRVTSGLRLGTPALTTRGMGENEMVRIAHFIKRVLDQPNTEQVLEGVRREVRELCAAFPVYPHLDQE